MATYLLVWNPRRWHWFDDDPSRAAERRGGSYYTTWSCGSKRIVRGDRVFMIKLGEEPKGIFASGWALSSPYADKTWDEARRGQQATYIEVRLDTLLNPAEEAIFPRHRLKQGRLAAMHWDSQMSGVEIPSSVANVLEREWSAFIGRSAQAPRGGVEFKALEGLPREARRYTRGRNKTLRDLALGLARGVCEACGTDYGAVLNGKGVRVLQVHHKRQLAADDEPRLTRVRDLAVVCANCHALIHMDPRRAVPVQRLRKMLQS